MSPKELGEQPEDREGLRKRTRLVLALYWGLLALLIPGAVVGALLSRPWWEGAMIVPFWILVLTRWGIYVRFRSLGAYADLMLLIWVIATLFGVMATVIFAFVPRA